MYLTSIWYLCRSAASFGFQCCPAMYKNDGKPDCRVWLNKKENTHSTSHEMKSHYVVVQRTDVLLLFFLHICKAHWKIEQYLINTIWLESYIINDTSRSKIKQRVHFKVFFSIYNKRFIMAPPIFVLVGTVSEETFLSGHMGFWRLMRSC